MCNNRLIKLSSLLVAKYLIELTALELRFFLRMRADLHKRCSQVLCEAGLSVFGVRSLSASRLLSYQQLNHVVSAAFHRQYRDTERKRVRERLKRKKKRGETEWREKRGGPGQTVTVCLFVFVSAGMFESKTEVMS